MADIDDLIDKWEGGDRDSLKEHIRQIRADRKVSKKSLTKRTERSESQAQRFMRLLDELDEEQKKAFLEGLNGEGSTNSD